MTRFVFFSFYFAIVAPISFVAVSWLFYAYRPEPNWAAIVALMSLVLAAPFAALFAASRIGRRSS
jgi:hypothetical protein